MTDMRFEWDPAKADSNRRKHGIDFLVALRVFADPFHLTSLNGVEDGEYRWETIGRVNGQYVLLVIHTDRGFGADEVARIISARKSTSAERRKYEAQTR